MKIRSIPLLALIACGATSWTSAAESGWKAGLASTVITPKGAVMLAGYASRAEPATEVLDDLHAKALALEDANGTRAVILTADILGFSAAIGNPVRERISTQTGVPFESILLSASHTHTGPALILAHAEDSTMSAEQAEKNIAHTRWLQDACVELAIEAVANLRPARLSTGSGVVNFPMNRREFTAKGVILGVNPRGLVDRGVPVLRIDDAEGGIVGVLFRASCHNTTFGSRDNAVSGDFAGYAQAAVERELPGVQAMFMQGFAGDTNPHPNSHNDPAKRPSVEIAKAHGEELGSEVIRVLNGKLQPVAGPLRTAHSTVKLPLQKAPPRDELEKLASTAGSWRKWVAGRMLAEASENGSAATHYDAALAVWNFGPDLTMVSLSGEVVIDYARRIEDAIGPLNLWLNAYCHDTFGYIPSARILREGGYETRGIYTGGIGFFAPEAEEVLVDKVKEMNAAVSLGLIKP